MKKGQLHDTRKRIERVKAVHLLLLAVIFGLLAVYGLRSNYTTMVELREAVYQADRQNGNTEAALQALRSHVYSHMNTDLSSGDNPIKPPIQLKVRYERLAAAEQQRVKDQNNKITADAEAICAQQFPAGGYNAPRVSCVQDYVSQRAVSQAAAVPEQLYKFDFISPRWSPDLAGISLVLSVTCFLLFILRVLAAKLLRIAER